MGERSIEVTENVHSYPPCNVPTLPYFMIVTRTPVSGRKRVSLKLFG